MLMESTHQSPVWSMVKRDPNVKGSLDISTENFVYYFISFY